MEKDKKKIFYNGLWFGLLLSLLLILIGIPFLVYAGELTPTGALEIELVYSLTFVLLTYSIERKIK